jgi:hypothetical protein
MVQLATWLEISKMNTTLTQNMLGGWVGGSHSICWPPCVATSCSSGRQGAGRVGLLTCGAMKLPKSLLPHARHEWVGALLQHWEGHVDWEVMWCLELVL